MPYVLVAPTQDNPEIHVGDFGTQFISTINKQTGVPIDISGATSITFRFLKPNGTAVDKTGSLYMGGTTGKTIYIIEDGLFDVSGLWKYQVIILIGGGKWYTNIVEFTVYPNIQ